MIESYLLGLKIIYSEEIIAQIKDDEKRKHFLDLVNSIPDDLFNGTNIIKLRKNQDKFASFTAQLNRELEDAGMNETLKKRKDEYSKDWIKRMPGVDLVLKGLKL